MGDARDSMVDTIQETVREKVEQVQQAATSAVDSVQDAAKNAVGLGSSEEAGPRERQPSRS
jgi:cellobiose-specific phosphotransferase system component IIA